MLGAAAVFAALAVQLAPVPAQGQADPVGRGQASDESGAMTAAVRDRHPANGEALRMALASALVPGAGQFLQGRRRWIVFLTAEAAAWTFHLDARQDGRSLRSEYQDLAWSVARGAPQPRIDGGFEYYERLGQWVRSGRFDLDPASPGIEPERDPSSYNGAQWNLAASIYLQGDPDVGPGAPGYAAALEYYGRRAYPAEFQWDWTAAPDDRVRFRALIEKSDDRFRTASVALAVVAGNHLLSAVDAFAATRLRQQSPVTASFEPGPASGSTYLVLRLLLPRGAP
jgi:hypothetical protein